MQPEADELLAALAPETEADEDNSFISESEGASDGGSVYNDWDDDVYDSGGGICSI